MAVDAVSLIATSLHNLGEDVALSNPHRAVPQLLTTCS